MVAGRTLQFPRDCALAGVTGGPVHGATRSGSADDRAGYGADTTGNSGNNGVRDNSDIRLWKKSINGARDLTDGAWRHEQMHVIGHQYVSVDLAAFAQGDLTQVATVTFVVSCGEEARPPVIAALDDMLGDVGKVDARSAWHAVAGSSKSRRV